MQKIDLTKKQLSPLQQRVRDAVPLTNTITIRELCSRIGTTNEKLVLDALDALEQLEVVFLIGFDRSPRENGDELNPAVYSRTPPQL